jgi:hypothetical protein
MGCLWNWSRCLQLTQNTCISQWSDRGIGQTLALAALFAPRRSQRGLQESTIDFCKFLPLKCFELFPVPSHELGVKSPEKLTTWLSALPSDYKTLGVHLLAEDFQFEVGRLRSRSQGISE